MPNVKNHSTLTGLDLHLSKIDVEVGTPVTAPTFIGQTWLDSNTNILYISNGTASLANWVISNYVQTETVSTDTVLPAINGSLIVSVDCSGGPINITLPPHNNGIEITIVDFTGNSLSNNITIIRDGGIGTIQNVASSFIIDSDYASNVFLSNASTSDWRII